MRKAALFGKKYTPAQLAAIAVTLAVLVLIWPLGLIRGEAFDASDRLLFERDYTNFYLSGDGEYVSATVEGRGQHVSEVAVCGTFREAEVTEETELDCYMLDIDGQIVFEEYLPAAPLPRYGVYRIPVDVTLKEGELYTFVVMLSGDGIFGVECHDVSYEPAIVLRTSEEAAGLSPSAVSASGFTAALKAAAWLAGLALIAGILAGFPMRRVLAVTITGALLMAAAAQYLWDLDLQSAQALRFGSAAVLLMAVLVSAELFLPEYRLFIWSGMLLAAGFFFLTGMPHGQVPDEVNHFLRAFDLSCGHLMSMHLSDGSGGDVLPAALLLVADRAAVLDWTDVREIAFTNTSLYAPVCYIPQAVGIKIARIFTSNVYTIFMAGRAGAFAASFLLSVYALKKMPFGKTALFVVMMLPMTLQEMASMSSDALTNAFAFAFIAAALEFIDSGRRLSRKDLAVLTALASALALCKLVYVVLIAVFLLIPAKQLGQEERPTKARLNRIILFGVPMALDLVSSLVYRGYVSSFGDRVDGAEQAKFILTHPSEIIGLALRETVQRGNVYFRSMTADYMGLLVIRTAGIIVPVLLVVMVYAVTASGAGRSFAGKTGAASGSPDSGAPEGTGGKRGLSASVLLILIAAAGYVLVCASMYVLWTPVGDPSIVGIQGRYFIALLPPLFAGIICGRKGGEEASEPAGVWAVDLILFWTLIMTMGGIFHYYMLQ